MGGGKSSSSSAPVITEEQKELLRAQTGFLTGTAFPAYQATIKGAGDVYGQVSPAVTEAAQTALDVTGRTGAMQEAAGAGSLGFGTASLAFCLALSTRLNRWRRLSSQLKKRCVMN